MVGTYPAVQLLDGGMYRLVMSTMLILTVRDTRWGQGDCWKLRELWIRKASPPPPFPALS